MLKKPEEQEKNIVAALKQERLKQNISHEKLAELTSLSRSAISMIESEDRHARLLTCLKIAEALKVDLGKIISKYGE